MPNCFARSKKFYNTNAILTFADHSATQIEDLDEILPMIYEMEAFKNRKTEGY